MINAWSLLYEELNGTMDKTYPIKNTDIDTNINITTGTGNTAVVNVPDDPITLGAGSTASVDTLNINVPAGFGAADTISINTDSYFPGGNDHIDFGGFAGTAYDDYITMPVPDFTSGIDTYADQVDTLVDGMGSDSKPTPDLNFKSQKYQEDKGIKDLKDYVSSTYRGHYTNKNSDTQTLDLIHSVGDAESFCRSNALKYLSRYDKKGTAKQDILKAMHYCLLLYYFSGNTKEPDYTNTRYETF